MADCAGGCLLAGQGADGELNLTSGALSLYVRLQNPTGDWSGCGIVSKYGGHDRLTYNLYGNAGTLGFELGTEKGLFRVDVPAKSIGPTDWHDVIVRYDGKRLEMLVDGIPVDDQAAAGSVRTGNTEPLVLAGYSVGGQPRGPFKGRLDTVALWKRALSEAEIVALSGGEADVERRRKAHQAAQYVDLPGPVAEFRRVVKSTDVATYSRAALALRRWMIENDPHRPGIAMAVEHRLGGRTQPLAQAARRRRTCSARSSTRSGSNSRRRCARTACGRCPTAAHPAPLGVLCDRRTDSRRSRPAPDWRSADIAGRNRSGRAPPGWRGADLRGRRCCPAVAGSRPWCGRGSRAPAGSGC